MLIHRGFTIKLGEFETRIMEGAGGYLEAFRRFEDVDWTVLPTDADDLERSKLAPEVQAAETHGFFLAKIDVPPEDREDHRRTVVALFYRLGNYFLTGFRRSNNKDLLWRSIFLLKCALEHEADSYRVRNALGAAYLHAGDLSKAEEHLSVAVNLPDAGPEAWFHRSVIFSTRRQGLSGKEADACRDDELKCLMAALELKDSHYESNYNIATVHAEKGELASAYARLVKCLSLNEGAAKKEIELDRELFTTLWHRAPATWQQKLDALCATHNIRGFGEIDPPSAP